MSPAEEWRGRGRGVVETGKSVWWLRQRECMGVGVWVHPGTLHTTHIHHHTHILYSHTQALTLAHFISLLPPTLLHTHTHTSTHTYWLFCYLLPPSHPLHTHTHTHSHKHSHLLTVCRYLLPLSHPPLEWWRYTLMESDRMAQSTPQLLWGECMQRVKRAKSRQNKFKKVS